MTPDELRALCGDGTGTVTLRIERRHTGGSIVRLLARSGPRGIVVGSRGGATVAQFSAKALLRWLDRIEADAFSRKVRAGG